MRVGDVPILIGKLNCKNMRRVALEDMHKSKHPLFLNSITNLFRLLALSIVYRISVDFLARNHRSGKEANIATS